MSYPGSFVLRTNFATTTSYDGNAPTIFDETIARRFLDAMLYVTGSQRVPHGVASYAQYRRRLYLG